MMNILAPEGKHSSKNILLAAQKLSKVYNSGGEAFEATRRIDLEIYRGDFTVIMGSSGSGKSTLLYLLSGLDQASSGSILFRGQLMEGASEKTLSELRTTQLGFVYQSINLIPDLTIYENIAFPGHIAKTPKEQLRAKVISLMERMDIIHQKNRMPSEVSGGQQQRAAIARALVNSPEVLFADEPTGALSVNQGKIILDILTELNQEGQSIVMVTHDLKAACRANRLIFIKDGSIGGMLELPKYTTEMTAERERQIYSFISRRE